MATLVRPRVSVFTVLKVLFLLGALVVTLYPLLYMLSISLSDTTQVLLGKVGLIPKGVNLFMYEFVLRDQRIFTSYRNTIFYVVTGTTLSLLITAAAAFSLSKRRVVFHRFFTVMVIVTMFFGGGMIPTYLTIRGLGLIDTIWAVLLPSAMSTYNLLVMRTFFDQFPREIEESGQLDGLNDIQILTRLVLPSSKAVLASIGLFYAVSRWNAYFEPFLYLNNPDLFPLQIILRNILQAGQTNVVGGGDTLMVEDSLRYTAVIVSILPIIAVYPFLQTYFVKGVMLGAVKG
jgi:putative aldouronate transport system permease protein